MKAKPIPGEHCYFCGNSTLPLVKMPCCEEYSCCDTEYISFKGGGTCQFEHETYSICHSHYVDKHSGKWQECEKCREFFGEEDFNHELEYFMRRVQR